MDSRGTSRLGRDAFFSRALRLPAALLGRVAGALLAGLVCGLLPGAGSSTFAAELAHTRILPSAAPATDAGGSLSADSDPVRAQLWDLSVSEYARYKRLMQGIRGSISPATLSPIEVLGIHARGDAERRDYAERWARMLHEDVARIAAFDRAYAEALTRLGYRAPALEASPLAPGDRVLLFARPDCARCGPVLARALDSVRSRKIAGLDIFLLGLANDDEAVRAWARAQAIEPELVRARTVTLNHDRGTLAGLASVSATLPYLMRKRGGDYAALDPWGL